MFSQHQLSEEEEDVVFDCFVASGIGCAFPAIAGAMEPSQLEASRWALKQQEIASWQRGP